VPGILIDDSGKQWADDSPPLLHRLGCDAPDFDLAAYTVRNLGFIHVQPHGAGIRVTLRAGKFSAQTLISALYAIVDKSPRRILLAAFSGEEWSYEMFTKLGSFAARVETLAAGEAVTAQRRLAMENAAARTGR